MIQASIKRPVFIIAAVFISTAAMAQRDTGRKVTTIDITSSYKPVLRNAVKVNFSASPLDPDSTLPNFKYDIPAENLFYSYQPVPSQARFLDPDTNMYLGQRNFVKLGYGNLRTPYVSAGLSFGNAKKSLLNVYGDYRSSRGKIKYQDYSQINVRALGNYFGEKNEYYGGVEAKMNNFYLYGYDQNLFKYSKDDLRQRFMDFSVNAGMRNMSTDEYGISYNPRINVSHFISKDKLSETTAAITAPVEKTFAEVLTLKAEAKVDYTNYSTKNMSPGNVHFSNTVIQVSPSLQYATPNLTINGGISPAWDNGKFIWLPNVYAEARIKDNMFRLQAGWVGRVTKNTYRNLSAINPYLAPLGSQLNTKEVEFYGGVKATMLKHFNINAKVGLIRYTNLPFFINDTATDSKAFLISNESSVSNLQFHGDISYINSERFMASAGVTFNGYTLMQDNARAWNTLPVEFTASLRWWAYKQVLLKADFYAFGNGYHLLKGNTYAMNKPGNDLSAGAEFKINKRFSAWLDVNNILNNKYQRWHSYEVYGLNLVTGLKVTF